MRPQIRTKREKGLTVDGVNLPEGPIDPFIDDPNDPAVLFDERDDVEPLSAEERSELEIDLEELVDFRRTLEPDGVHGIAVECADCGEMHYFSWDLMAGNLHALLGEGRTHVHEPAFDPHPDLYVSWDYARGYTDATKAAARRR
jgi:hypothetical protein